MVYKKYDKDNIKDSEGTMFSLPSLKLNTNDIEDPFDSCLCFGFRKRNRHGIRWSDSFFLRSLYLENYRYAHAHNMFSFCRMPNASIDDLAAFLKD